MRGVVVKIEDSGTIVMFNNGKIGRIPTPPGCRRGMVVTVRVNRKRILVPAMGILFFIILGGFIGFLLLTRGTSPEEFCYKPFLDKSIVIPNRDYPGFTALFTHLGQPLREFTVDYPVVQNEGDLVRGFNYAHYNIITYYDHIHDAITVFEIILNSKSSQFTGKFSIGDDKSLLEKYFNSYINGNRKGYVFSYKNNDMKFTMENTVLTFKFNGKNKLTNIVMSLRRTSSDLRSDGVLNQTFE